jgi:hypothetical protein
MGGDAGAFAHARMGAIGGDEKLCVDLGAVDEPHTDCIPLLRETIDRRGDKGNAVRFRLVDQRRQ